MKQPALVKQTTNKLVFEYAWNIIKSFLFVKIAKIETPPVPSLTPVTELTEGTVDMP